MSEYFLGEIRIVPFNFAPRNWAMCSGQLMSIAQNTALFSLLGTTFGGNGTATFGLPDLRGRTPTHQGDSVSGSFYEMGQVDGTEQVTILPSQVPVHTHALASSETDPSTSATQAAGRVLAKATAAVYADAAPGTPLSSASVTPSNGQSLPHSNMQPFLTFNLVIALRGIFPSRG